MGTKRVLAISGSPSRSSKTVVLTKAALERLQRADIETSHVAARDLDPNALLTGDAKDPTLSAFLDKVMMCHGIIIATPIYKASFSGLLKAALDILPQYALAGKVVLPLGAGGSLAHVLALDYALRPVIQSMGARHIVQSHFVLDADLIKGGCADWDAPHLLGLRHACDNFIHSLTDDASVIEFGHPRPTSIKSPLVAVGKQQSASMALDNAH
jgi:FMN reductase